MVQAYTLFPPPNVFAGSRVGRVGIGLLTTLTGLGTAFLGFGSRFLPRSGSLGGLGTFALTRFLGRRILTRSLSPLSSEGFEEAVRLSMDPLNLHRHQSEGVHHPLLLIRHH